MQSMLFLPEEARRSVEQNQHVYPI
jgi:hypothetical protein